MDVNKTGAFLAALRRSHGYTQQEVADYLNISNRTVSKWEQGGGYPDLTLLPILAEYYEVTVDEILAGEKVSRQTDSDRLRGAALRRRLMSRMGLHFHICMVAVFTLVLLTRTVQLKPWSPLFPILAGAVLICGLMVSRYELYNAKETLSQPEQSDLSRTVGLKAFLALDLILWSLTVTPQINTLYFIGFAESGNQPLALYGIFWAAILLTVWIWGRIHWKSFLYRLSGVVCGSGLTILILSDLFQSRLVEMLRIHFEGIENINSSQYPPIHYANRVYQKIHLFCVLVIAGSVLIQLLMDKRKKQRDISEMR